MLLWFIIFLLFSNKSTTLSGSHCKMLDLFHSSANQMIGFYMEWANWIALIVSATVFANVHKTLPLTKSKAEATDTVWKVSVFGVFLVRFPAFDDAIVK